MRQIASRPIDQEKAPHEAGFSHAHIGKKGHLRSDFERGAAAVDMRLQAGLLIAEGALAARRRPHIWEGVFGV
jgi:hypothetical protein